jgi:hypothetical protein
MPSEPLGGLDLTPIHDLHLLGVDYTKLAYKYNGRQFRLTDVAGTVIDKLLA